MTDEDSCFGHYPINECDQATCKDLCQDVEGCKRYCINTKWIRIAGVSIPNPEYKEKEK